MFRKQLDRSLYNYTVLITRHFIGTIYCHGWYMLVQVKWYLNGEEAYSGVSIEGDEGFSRITVKNMSADKAGKYKIVAENRVGSAEAEFTVVVKGEIVYSCLEGSFIGIEVQFDMGVERVGVFS